MLKKVTRSLPVTISTVDLYSAVALIGTEEGVH